MQFIEQDFEFLFTSCLVEILANLENSQDVLLYG